MSLKHNRFFVARSVHEREVDLYRALHQDTEALLERAQVENDRFEEGLMAVIDEAPDTEAAYLASDALRGFKYVCWSGLVTSRHDGDTHRISAQRLPHLYGVDQEECIYADTERPDTVLGRSELFDVLFHLFPDSSGAYELPTERGKW